MSKERPFTPRAQEFERILAGRQTQFRRPVKPQPPTAIYHDGHGLWYPTGPWSGQDWRCPFGVSGDTLWLKEKWRVARIGGTSSSAFLTVQFASGWGVLPYRVDWRMFYAALEEEETHWEDSETGNQWGAWRAAATMPRWASRLMLRVLKVGVERVQDIDEIGAQKEGWFYQGHNLHHAYDPVTMDTARRWFIEQWDAAYAAQGFGFDASPWIWKVDFELVPLGYNEETG